MASVSARDLAALQKRLATAQGTTKNALARIVAELDCATRLRALHPEKSGVWERLIDRAHATVIRALDDGKLDGLPDAVAAAERTLAPIGEVAKTYTVYNVGHGHIDMNWMWSWPETVAVTNDTFSTVDRLMEAYPTFTYAQSQASVYEAMRTHNPDLFARIKKRVEEGRWEVTASMWVECDKNLPVGESYCRHLLYTRRFMREHLGLKPEDVAIDWSPDTFGHAHTLPSFLVRAGVKRYYHCRTGIDQERPAVFWWKAPDGSRVLVYKEISGSWYNGRIDAETILPAISRFCGETGIRTWMNVYGVGDHGGGPTRDDCERAIEMNGWPIFPNIVHGTTKQFYDVLEQNGDRWPTLDMELNYEFMGCYTAESNIKRANRYGEQLLYRAEVAAAFAWDRIAREYPTERLRDAWINVLFNQFHDILPGSGVKETYEYAQGLFQQTAAQAGAIATESLRALSGRIDTAKIAGERPAKPGPATGAGAGHDSGLGGVSRYDGAADAVRPFVVWNLTGWPRSTTATAMLWDTNWDRNGIVVTDDAGNTCPAQVLGTGHYWGHTYLEIAFPTGVIPSMGWRTFAVREGAADPYPGAVTSPARGVLENEHLRVKVDWETGCIAELVEKKSGANLADPDEPMGLLEFAIERHHGMTAWVVGDIKSSEFLTTAESLDQKGGPYLGTITGKYKVADSEITVRLSVRAGDPCVELAIDAQWLERGYPERGVPMLRLNVPVAVEDRTARYEIPFGTITRELSNGEEVPSIRFADVSGTADGGVRAGVTMVNDSKYGHSLAENNLRLTLIRSSYDPDWLPEMARHHIRVGLVPHGGEWTEADAVCAGFQFNEPIVVVGTDVHGGGFAPSGSFLAVDAPNVVVAAVKKAEDGDGLIVRLYETAGKDTTARLKVDGMRTGRMSTVDLLEEKTAGTIKVNNEGLSVHVPAYGITTVKVGR